MTVAKTYATALVGIDGHLVDIEACVTHGVPGLHLIGLPDTCLAETRDRVRAAIINSALPWPRRHVTVSLTPAALPKRGSAFDLAIATAALAADGVLPSDGCGRTVLLGELGLDGRVRPVQGVLPAVLAAAARGIATVIVPTENLAEARLVSGITAVGVTSLSDAVAYLRGEPPTDPEPQSSAPLPRRVPREGGRVDLADVVLSASVRRALEIAAAGGHHLDLIGHPGSGKVLAADLLAALLPPLTDQQSLEVTAIHSAAGALNPHDPLITRPPVRAPHHTCSRAALSGGGRIARPGAVSLAHRGVLLLDDAPEFSSSCLEVLRQPLARRQVEIVNTSGSAVRFPAAIQLVLASVPCWCSESGEGCCDPQQRARYQARVPAFLREGIDLQVTLPAPRTADMAASASSGESTAVVAARVAAARDRAATRLRGTPWHSNAELRAPHLLRHFTLDADATQVVNGAFEAGALTGRALGRVLRTAWTIADLDAHDRPTRRHVQEALDLLHGRRATRSS